MGRLFSTKQGPFLQISILLLLTTWSLGLNKRVLSHTQAYAQLKEKSSCSFQAAFTYTVSFDCHTNATWWVVLLSLLHSWRRDPGWLRWWNGRPRTRRYISFFPWLCSFTVAGGLLSFWQQPFFWADLSARMKCIQLLEVLAEEQMLEAGNIVFGVKNQRDNQVLTILLHLIFHYG